MVTVEELSGDNFLSVVDVSKDIKDAMEMTPPDQDFVYIPRLQHIIKFPVLFPVDSIGTRDHYCELRLRAVKYLKDSGYIESYTTSTDYIDRWDKDIKIHFNSKKFLSFYSHLIDIYTKRVAEPEERREAIETLTDEQVEKLHKVLDAIAFRIESEREPTIIYIPYDDFPKDIERFELHGLLYKLANDFKVFGLGKHIEKEVDLRFHKEATAFSELRQLITKKYRANLSNPKTKVLREKLSHQEEKIQKVEVVNPHLNVKVQPDTIASKVGRFPGKLKAGTQWKDIAIAFTDERNVVISVNGQSIPQSCEDMKLVKGKYAKPVETWNFLELLARKNGEIFPDDSDAKPSFKKQKELLSTALKAYFQKESDPFFSYEPSTEKRDRSYKTRFAVFYQAKPQKEDPYADLNSERDRIMRSV